MSMQNPGKEMPNSCHQLPKVGQRQAFHRDAQWKDNGNHHKLQQRKFYLDMRTKMFTVRLIQQWKRFPREAGESQFLQIFKAHLHMVLRNLLYLIIVWGRSWIGWHPEVSSDLHCPLFLWNPVQSLGCSWRNAVRNICLFGTHPQVSPKEKSCNHLLKKEKARIAVSFKTHDSGDCSTQVLYEILLPKALAQEMAILSDLSGSKQVQGSHQEIRILKKGSGTWRSWHLWWNVNVSFQEIMSPIFTSSSGLSFAWAQMEKQPWRWGYARLYFLPSSAVAPRLKSHCPWLLPSWPFDSHIIYSAKIQLQQQAPSFLPSHRWAAY